jgi:hypothetical protein
MITTNTRFWLVYLALVGLGLFAAYSGRLSDPYIAAMVLWTGIGELHK